MASISATSRWCPMRAGNLQGRHRALPALGHRRPLVAPLLRAIPPWRRLDGHSRPRPPGGAELPLIISDHADWSELTQTLKDVGAPKVWVTHGVRRRWSTMPLDRHRSRGPAPRGREEEEGEA